MDKKEEAVVRLRAWVEKWVSDYYDPVIDPDIHDDLRLVLDMPPCDRED